MSAAAKADFNGDSYGDLAVGVPGETVNGQGGAGAINVIYGSSTGLKSNGSQLFSQDSVNCADVAEPSDSFGNALATGDFNKDGFSDLAIGVYREGVGAISEAGVVQVLYGSGNGLTCSGSQLWSQNSVTGGTAKSGSQFGFALAAGDFNNDGYADLAVGAPYDNVTATLIDAGSVTIFYGRNSGLSATGAQVWTLESPGVVGTAAVNDHFGSSLAAGNFGKGAWTDLAIGIRSKNVAANGQGNHGA